MKMDILWIIIFLVRVIGELLVMGGGGILYTQIKVLRTD